MHLKNSYLAESISLLKARLDLIASTLIAQLLPVIAAIASAVIAVVVAVIAVLASPEALPLALAVALIIVGVAAILGAAVGIGGLALTVLDAARGVKRGLLEPFKDAWRLKWGFTKLILAVALINVAVLALAALPVLPAIVGVVRQAALEASSPAGSPAFLSRLYLLLAPVVAAGVALKLVLEPSYVFAAMGGGVWESIRRGFYAAIEIASSDPLGFVVFFLLYLFPDVLLFLYPEVFLAEPTAADLFSLVVWAKNLVVEPLYLLAIAEAGGLAGGGAPGESGLEGVGREGAGLNVA